MRAAIVHRDARLGVRVPRAMWGATCLELGGRWREAGLLKARLCRARAKPRSSGAGGTRSHAVGRPADRRATPRGAGRGCAVGLYAPLPVSLDGQRGRSPPLDPADGGVSWRSGRPVASSCGPSPGRGETACGRCPSACDPAVPIPHGWRWRLGAHRERGPFPWRGKRSATRGVGEAAFQQAACVADGLQAKRISGSPAHVSPAWAAFVQEGLGTIGGDDSLSVLRSVTNLAALVHIFVIRGKIFYFWLWTVCPPLQCLVS